MTNIYKRYMRIALIALLIACIISIPFMFLKKPPVHNTIADNSLDSQEISSESSEISAVSGTLTSADISDATSLLPPPSAIEKSSSQSVQPQPPPPKSNDGFMNGVWISVFDYNVKGLGENDFRARMAKIFDDCADSLITDVFCHVRPYADSFYPSAIFPMSEYLSGTQGISPGYNPLQIMIEAAHARNLRFHAWINPYRISAKTSDVMQLSDKSPAKIFATDSDSGNDRYAVSWENGI
ncbi:MAG: family 10 glycosylhydrolase, partial [Oscillospiraceae bacterium]